ncbi:Dedicator of cytokinesis protein 6, putative isoform 2 [Hibiscus syriacus]|uniref:Dedicator of cytokinesis protein 6, putative isoform 2 n=1 Tax=Hibiscus syriacus TaxID=106335 RepID=A0A6A2ZAJ4_HIBSY|nr:nuclear pore complex protein NUP1-like [Hibiscus syriacus]KAE8689024.1 Dedicator of cytokinesis protein 6, putative isoform 2 [Hibiscus syriacus]
MQEEAATERGAGGKLRRQPPRRPPATPYARPQQNQSLRGRLHSKLVDPACRLIVGGATRILPSLFKSFSIDSLPPPEPQAHVQFDGDIEEYDNEEDQNCATFVESKTAGTSGETDGPKAGSDSAENRKGHQRDTNDDGISEIEKLVKGKTFSRDEINRLIEIINSKDADVPKVNQESKDLILSTGRPEGPIVATNLRRQTKEKQDDLNKAVRDLETPLPKPTLLDETAPSPIEIAKAYMANRTSEVNLGSKSIISKEERQTMLADDFASEPFAPFASPKPSAGWPVSMVLDQRGYLTPQSQRSRFGLHNIPRTPYSRTIYSKSKSKLAHVRDESDGFLNGSFSPLQRSQTHAYGQLRRNVMDNGQGSVGPIRRIRHKGTAETPSRGSVYSHSSLNGSFPVVNSNIPKGLSPSIKRTMEQGGTSSSSVFQLVDKNRSSEMGMPPVHPHSSQMARTILDHLDRTLVTPKEKSEELKAATSWKISQSSDANAAVLTGYNNVPNLGLDYSKSKDKINSRSPALPWDEKSISVASPESNMKKTNSTSNLEVDRSRTATMLGSNAVSSIDSGKTRDSQMKTAHKDLPNLTGVPVFGAVASEGLQKPSSNSSGNKPVLASISVTKPEQRWMFTPDNSTGFTFQVSASSGMSSEPPTPTIVPSILGSSQHQPKEELTGPTYTFGLNRSSPALVFSFPLTSSAPNHIDASDITFNFGPERSSRISFSSIGKDATCH